MALAQLPPSSFLWDDVSQRFVGFKDQQGRITYFTGYDPQTSQFLDENGAAVNVPVSDAEVLEVVLANDQLGAMAPAVQTLIDVASSSDKNRANHTGTQDDGTILHGSTALDQVVSSLLVTQTTTIPAMQSNQTSLLQRVSSVENRLAVLEAVPPPTTPPVITAAPTLAFPGGTADQGETATITQGTYSGTAVTGRTYQQVYNNINVDNPIAGPTFTISQSGTLRIVELAAYSAGVVSNQSVQYTVTPTGTPPPTAPVALAKPTLAFTGGGAADAGDTATITQGTYTDPDNTVTGRTGQVIVNGLLHSTVVNGATGNTFIVPTEAETGARQLIYVELAQNTVGTDVSNSSLPYTVNSSAAAPVNIVPPSYANGSRTSGATLSVNTGSWTPTPDSFTYQHEANLVNIGGATNNNYVLTGSEVGDYITCLVTPYNGGVAGTAVRTRRTLCVDGAKTTVSMEWTEEVVTDADDTSNHPSAPWGMHSCRVTAHEDGVVRIAYPRITASVLYSRVMKRTGTATWVEDVEKQNNDCTDILIDPHTNLPMMVTWPDATRVPTIHYGASYASSVAISGGWESYALNGVHYGGVGIGPDGMVVQTEVHITGSTTADTIWDFNNLRLFGGTWTQGTQQAMNLATGSITPNGERFAYPYVLPYCTTGVGASDRFGYVALRDVNPGTGYQFDAMRIWHAAFNTTSGVVSAQIVSNPGTNYLNPTEGFMDSSLRVWTTRTISGQMRLCINNLDGSNTARLNEFNLSNFNDGYGRARIIQDSRGRFWGIWMGSGGTTAMKVMQITPSGTEPSGAITISQGSVTSLTSAFTGWASANSGCYLAVPRGGNYIDNKVYGYILTNQDATHKRVVAFCIHLPD